MPANNVGMFSATRDAMEPDWKMLRALRGGTEAMRAAGLTYMPRDFSELQNPKRYAERLARSFLFDGYDKAVKRVAGTPFQKPITVSELTEPSLAAIEEDANLCRTSLTAFGSLLMEDIADRGFCLILVDRPPEPESEDGTTVQRTRAEDDALGIRPYFARIVPDNIVGAKATIIAGRERITELRVRSVEWEPQPDYSEIQFEIVTIYREAVVEVWKLALDVRNGDANARSVVAEQHRQGHKLVKSSVPNWPNGVIPLVAVYANKLGPLYAKPPLLGLAWLNVEHWQSSSEQRWKLHYERCNILKARGLSTEEAERWGKGGMTLGAGAIAASSSPDFDVAWVEATGSSLEGGRKDLEAIEQRMERLGMEPLVQSLGPRTATGEMSADVKQQADAQRWAEALEWGLFDAYKFAADWVGETLPDDFTVAIWRDFAISQRSQQDLQTLDSARTRKDLSHETYLKEIQKRGVIGDDVDIDDEIERTDDEAESLAEMLPPMLPPGTSAPEAGQEGEDGQNGDMPPNQDMPPNRMPPRMAGAR